MHIYYYYYYLACFVFLVRFLLCQNHNIIKEKKSKILRRFKKKIGFSRQKSEGRVNHVDSSLIGWFIACRVPKCIAFVVHSKNCCTKCILLLYNNIQYLRQKWIHHRKSHYPQQTDMHRYINNTYYQLFTALRWWRASCSVLDGWLNSKREREEQTMFISWRYYHHYLLHCARAFSKKHAFNFQLVSVYVAYAHIQHCCIGCYKKCHYIGFMLKIFTALILLSPSNMILIIKNADVKSLYWMKQTWYGWDSTWGTQFYWRNARLVFQF